MWEFIACVFDDEKGIYEAYNASLSTFLFAGTLDEIAEEFIGFWIRVVR